MIGFYNWLICKVFKQRRVYKQTTEEKFARYCNDNPGALECRVYDI